MTTKNHQCSPYNLETTSNLVQKGAREHGIAYGISIPTTGVRISPSPHSEEGYPSLLYQAKARTPPVIWEARNELCRRGIYAIPVRAGSRTPVDIVAWDTRTLSFIAVRRSRTDLAVRDITIRYHDLITDLRMIRIPERTEVQLWISTRNSFQVYEVLAGGLIRRSLP